MKLCSKCRTEKPPDEFYIRPDRKNGARTSHCRACLAAYKKANANPGKKRASRLAWNAANPEKHKAGKKAWAAANRVKCRASVKAWTAKQPGGAAGVARRWQQSNPGKQPVYAARWAATHTEALAKMGAAWRKANPDKVNAIAARRRAANLQATPAWANEFYIGEIYALASLRTKLTGLEWQVDHIVPLQSKKVCGLHTEHNLQVIPARSNRVKSNRHWPDMHTEVFA